MKEYNIEFHDAIDLLLEGKWLKGHNFVEGHFIKLDTFGQIVLVDVKRMYHESPFAFLKSLKANKYRIITVATLKELAL